MLLERFEEASEFARGILVRMIRSLEALELAFAEATQVYQSSADKQVLVFEKNYDRPTWKRLATFPEPFFAVYPAQDGSSWKAEAIPVEPTTMESRKLLPEAWRGLRDDALAEATGVQDASFCHPSGFLIGAASKAGALELAKKAILM
jgi:uncharacterized UPF0160 family protein